MHRIARLALGASFAALLFLPVVSASVIDPQVLSPLLHDSESGIVDVRDLRLPDGRIVTLSLRRFDLVTPDAVIAIDNRSVSPFPARRYFRGSVVGDDRSVAFVSVGPNDLHGIVSSGDVKVAIETFDSPQREYRTRELPPSPPPGRACEDLTGTASIDDAFAIPQAIAYPNAVAPPVGTTLDIAIETDFELYQLLGSSAANVASYAADLVGYSSVVLARDVGVDLRLVYLSTWSTSADPWGGGTIFDQLYQLSSYWYANRKNVRRDAVHMMTPRQLSGGYGVGFLDTICRADTNSSGTIKGTYSVGTTEPASGPIYELFLHEFGHNLGSPHTHCYMPPVDMCYSGESGCYSGPTSTPPEGGTTMSYCPCPCGPPVYGVVGEPSEAVLNLLRTKVAARTLYPVLTAPSSACPGATVHASTADAAGNTYVWSVTNGSITAGEGTASVTATAGSSGEMTLTVTVSRPGYCPKTRVANVEILSSPTLAIDSVSMVCGGSGGNAASVADAGTGATYQWSIANGSISSGATSRYVSFTAGMSGSVTLSVTVSGAACAASGTKSIPIGPGPSPAAVISSPDVVFAGTMTNTASVPDAGAGATYDWTISNGWIRGSSTGSGITFGASNAGPATLRVLIRNASGCGAVATKDVRIAQPISIASISPGSGSEKGYDGVAIAGNGFASGAKLSFGSQRALSTTVVSGKLITAMTPQGTGTVVVKVENPDGGSATASFNYSHSDMAAILAVAPSRVPIAGGTEIVIDGIGFKPGAVVKFDNVWTVKTATSVTYVSPERLRAITPAVTAAGVYEVSVTNPDGTKSENNLPKITFYDPSFDVSSIVPQHGPAAGGTPITISGNGFVAGTIVTFGWQSTTAIPNVVVVNSSTITATTPAKWPGTIDVNVVKPGGATYVLESGFEYDEGTIASVGPASGPVTGGTTVTVNGTLLSSGMSFDNIDATVKSSSDTQVVAVSPPHTAGFVDVRVGPIHYTSVAKSAFRYIEVPAILSMTPASGSKNGGTAVTILGRGFQAGAIVKFGGVAATSVTIVDSARITATSPAHLPGAVDVTVQNPDGRVSDGGAGSFNYLDCLVKPTATVSGSTSICAGGSATIAAALTGKSPWNIQWSDGPSQSGVTSASITRQVTPTGTTTYTITSITDADCDGTATGSAVVTVKPMPAAHISGPLSLSPSSTGNAFSTPDAGVGATYSWSIQNGTITSGNGTPRAIASVGTTSPAIVSLSVALNGCSTPVSRTFLVTAQKVGDVDGDTFVTVRDIFFLIDRLYAGGAAPIGNADVNGDGQVTPADVVMLIDVLFGGA